MESSRSQNRALKSFDGKLICDFDEILLMPFHSIRPSASAHRLKEYFTLLESFCETDGEKKIDFIFLSCVHWERYENVFSSTKTEWKYEDKISAFAHTKKLKCFLKTSETDTDCNSPLPQYLPKTFCNDGFNFCGFSHNWNFFLKISSKIHHETKLA